MAIELRPYQLAANDALYAYFGSYTGNPLIVLPTGTGKSVVIASFCREAIAAYPETRILCITHVKELIAQNFQAMLRVWPEAPAGIYSAGLSRRDIRAQILFAGIQSIHKHAERVQRCDLIIIDEAQLIGNADNGMYRRFLREVSLINGGLTKVVGFTATPYRLDSGLLCAGEDRLFTDIAYEFSILDAIRQGYLSPVVSKRTATQFDLSGVGTRAGDYIQSQLEAALDRADKTSAAVAEIITAGQDRGSWLIFCAGVRHAQHVRDEMRNRGVDAEMVTGATPSGERAAILEAFKRGRLRCVTNANVLTTGFDAPGTDLIALLRPTKSAGLYVQMVGRGTRLAQGKDDCLVLDFARNVERHGPIDMIEGKIPKKKGDKENEAPVRVCAMCQAICHASARICANCGNAFPPPDPDKNLTDKPADGALLSTQMVPEWVNVRDVTYSGHARIGKPTSLCVTYHCGLSSHREWVSLEHEGYPRRLAESWWRRRTTLAVPHTVADALASVHELRKPIAIQIKQTGKYTEVVNVRFYA
jgi:DNA repair protein RadD